VSPLRTDVAIVGGGLAGLMTALALAPRAVTVIANAPLGAGAATGWAQGGIAAAFAADDAPALHADDTRRAGAGLCDPLAVDRLVGEAPLAVAALARLGTAFDRDDEGQFVLGREAGHKRRRIVHAGGDATGRAVLDALIAAVRRTPSIRVLESTVADDLLLTADGAVGGVLIRRADELGSPTRLEAGAVVLATGGIGRLYAYTTNPPQARGDGLAMAARAGARLSDCEFVQFHPTALAIGRDPMPLVTEALRGEGATLVDERGRRFMRGVHPDEELAPRDVVARAVYDVMRGGGQAYLDARGVGALAERFPTVFALCREAGIDPRSAPIPIAPAAHYHMGGVAIDLSGRTSRRGLWACGEVASSGVHGANRLASNSLLEALVYARRVAADIAASEPRARGATSGPRPLSVATTFALDEPALRKLMFEHVGVVRDRAGIETALERVSAAGEGGPLRNMLVVARAIATAAFAREESRGGHYRSDFPASGAAARRSSLLLYNYDDAQEMRSYQ
jgi:L-aspartate oxidase